MTTVSGMSFSENRFLSIGEKGKNLIVHNKKHQLVEKATFDVVVDQ